VLTKNKARLLQFIESGTLSTERFQNILDGTHLLAVGGNLSNSFLRHDL
jgi:hypothetical protein